MGFDCIRSSFALAGTMKQELHQVFLFYYYHHYYYLVLYRWTDRFHIDMNIFLGLVESLTKEYVLNKYSYSYQEMEYTLTYSCMMQNL